MTRRIGSPLMMAFLRVLAFVGITEALFYRMLPEPTGREQGLLGHVHASLSTAGDLTFLLAFFIVTAVQSPLHCLSAAALARCSAG